LVGPQDPVTLAEWFTSRQKWFRGQADWILFNRFVT
jgi:hypothetical protein